MVAGAKSPSLSSENCQYLRELLVGKSGTGFRVPGNIPAGTIAIPAVNF